MITIETKNILRYVGIVCIVLLIFALLRANYRADRDTQNPTDNNSTTIEINRATELNQQAGAQNKSVQQAVERAEVRVNNAQVGINDCETILTELRTDNQRAKQIIDEIIRGTQEGK